MKQKTVFLCSDCGYESPKWYGKCPSCGAWNTMSEFKPAAPSAARGTTSFVRGTSRPTLLGDIETGDEETYQVVGSQEADPMNRAISEDSPFGRALMGAKEGDEVSVEAPVGTIAYRIIKIER